MDGMLQVQLTVGAGALLGALLNALVLAYHAGKLNQRVASHEAKLNEHGVVLDEHGRTLREHECRISRIEGYRGISLPGGD